MSTVLDAISPVGEMERVTIPQVLARQAERSPEAPALLCPGQAPVTHGRLWEQIQEAGAQLRGWGIGVEDRVALVAPSGPELAVASLSVACVAGSVTLNPEYGPDDFARTLEALRVKAVIVPEGEEIAVVEVARRLGLGMLRFAPLAGGAAGLFRLTGEALGPARLEECVGPDDVAQISFTSGTTSRPKVVPLTHRVLCARALFPGRSPRLTSDDRGLIFRRVYGSGGTIALAALLSGGAAICPRDITPAMFFTCLEECRPTWCRTVPPLAQAIVAQAPPHARALAQASLRFLTVGSAALPLQVERALEDLLGVPVLPSYSMTEATPIARTPLPPRRRKAGSVGLIQGLDVAIMDEGGTVVAAGQTGEIVVRGPGVFGGYEGDPEANRQAFWEGGWFRTGDAGYLDEEGYLFITGRFKEMINRGGRKIAPREVEECLLEHPVVAQVVVFALPHTTLGEDVGAAVVLRPGMMATEREVRMFVGDRLAAFKVPRHVVFLDDLPVSAAGKVQRIGMAQRLGLETVEAPPYQPPRDGLEEMLVLAWSGALRAAQVGVHDNFFDLGGNSLLAAQVMAALEPSLGRRVPSGILLEAPTVAELADVLRTTKDVIVLPTVVALQPEGTRPPLFCVPYIGGPALGFQPFVASLGPDQPLYAFQESPPLQEDAPPRSIEEIAAQYVEVMCGVQAHGPYYLAGNSGGGVVAFEMAQQLVARGERVALLALLDAYCPVPGMTRRWPALLKGRLEYHVEGLVAKVRHHAILLQTRPVEERRAYVRQRWAGLRQRLGGMGSGERAAEDGREAAAREEVVAGARDRRRPRYAPRRYAGEIVLFWSSENPRGRLGAADPRLGWRRVAAGGLEIHRLPGDHSAFMFYAPYVRQMSVELQACLRSARRREHWGSATLGLADGTT